MIRTFPHLRVRTGLCMITGLLAAAAVAPASALAVFEVDVNSPPALVGAYVAMPATFGPELSTTGITGAVVVRLDPPDVPGPSTTDACSPLTNAAAAVGKIALVDRGSCNFTVKVKNAQEAAPSV